MDFLEMIDPDQGATVFDQWIPRARLGCHLRLSKIYEKLTFDDASTISAAIKEYLNLSGFDRTKTTGLQQVQAFLTLSELNRLKTIFAYQMAKGSPDDKEPPYTYPGRLWALYIHKLATRYGWTRDDVLELWPEEAAAYLQEIMISEYHELDERRSLVELSYKVEKGTNQAKFIPTPKPDWMAPKVEKKTIRVKRSWLPVGNVIKLSDKTEDDFILH